MPSISCCSDAVFICAPLLYCCLGIHAVLSLPKSYTMYIHFVLALMMAAVAVNIVTVAAAGETNDATIEIAAFGDRSFGDYLGQRHSNGNISDDEKRTKFKSMAKMVINASQALFNDKSSLGKTVRLKLVKVELVLDVVNGSFGVGANQTSNDAEAKSYLGAFCKYANGLQVHKENFP